VPAVFYWPGPSGPASGSFPGPPSVGDWDVLEAVRDAIEATGEFDGVFLPDLPEERGTSSGDGNAAWVSPLNWDESDEFQDPGDLAVLVRKVGWTLTLMVRRGESLARGRELSRLVAVCQNAVSGQSVGGLTIPAWTRLKSGRWEKARPPEQRLVSAGTFAYVVEGSPNHTAD
jgi:hypothetical protein